MCDIKQNSVFSIRRVMAKLLNSLECITCIVPYKFVPDLRLPKSLIRALAIVVLGTNTSLPHSEPVSLLCSAILQEYGLSP